MVVIIMLIIMLILMLPLFILTCVPEEHKHRAGCLVVGVAVMGEAWRRVSHDFTHTPT